MILSKKTKHGLLSMGLAFGILTSSVVSPASVSVLASDYSARNVLSDAYIPVTVPGTNIRRGHNLCLCPKRGFAASEQQKSI